MTTTKPKPKPGDGVGFQRPLDDKVLPGWLDPEAPQNLGPMSVLLLAPTKRDGRLPISPFFIARSIKERVGSIDSIYRDKEKNLVLKLRGAARAKKLMQMTKLIDGTEVTVTEHPRLNQVRCVVSCGSVEELSVTTIQEELEEQGVVGVHRFQKGGKPTATMVLTIRGTEIPEVVFFGFERCKTRVYTQPPLQCYRCYGFGHSKARCKSEVEVCRNCSGTHPIQKDDDGKTVCKEKSKCRNCNGAHSPANRSCPTYKTEDEVNKIRTTQGVSPREARRIFEDKLTKTNTGNYATATSSNRSETEELRKELKATKFALIRALEELAKLKKAFEAGSKPEQPATPPKQITPEDKKEAGGEDKKEDEEEEKMDDTPADPDRKRRRDSQQSSNSDDSDDPLTPTPSDGTLTDGKDVDDNEIERSHINYDGTVETFKKPLPPDNKPQPPKDNKDQTESGWNKAKTPKKPKKHKK